MGSIASIGAGIRQKTSDTVRTVMTLATNNVINSTPVDTGHAASNWILTFGQPYTDIVGSRESVDWSVQRAGLAKLATYDVGRDGVVCLRNNVPYLKYLDAGSSQQAPANFIAIALMGGARAAPHGMKERSKSLLRHLSKAAYARGQRP